MRQQQQTPKPVSPMPEPAPAPFVTATRPPSGPVRVIAGADVQDLELAGRTVAESRALAVTVLGVHPRAPALVDGRAVGEDHVLESGQQLQFVKHAGSKGARGPCIELVGTRATWRRLGRSLETSVGELLGRVGATGAAPDTWQLHPEHVRLMVSRRGGSVMGVVIEMPPGPRQVRWIRDDSPEPFGPGATYAPRHLSFPFVVLVVVFVEGQLSHLQQAFFRPAPLASADDPLYLTNLLNVARGYGQESWVCLVGLTRDLEDLAWPERIRTVARHFWEAAFNRSSEMHEDNSYWGTMRGLDPRLETPEAWEAATRADPYFTLGVPWRRAAGTLRETLAGMLDEVAPWQPIERAEQLATLMQRGEEA